MTRWIGTFILGMMAGVLLMRYAVTDPIIENVEGREVEVMEFAKKMAELYELEIEALERKRDFADVNESRAVFEKRTGIAQKRADLIKRHREYLNRYKDNSK